MSRSLLAIRTTSCMPDRARRRLHVSQLASVIRTVRIDEHANRRRAAGTSSRRSSSRFGSSSPAKRVTPVTLPPGRLRLATRPSLDRIAADREDDRDRRGRGLGRERRGIATGATITATWRSNQIGRQRRQSIVVTFRPAVFDRHVLALDEAGFVQALAERGTGTARRRRRRAARNPITGIAGCCARAASGHAAAAPPSSVMNSRRFTRSPRRRGRAALATR